MSDVSAYFQIPNRPLPEILPEWRAFFNGCKRGSLVIESCATCQRKQFYPRGQCLNCGGSVEEFACSGRGLIYSVTTIHMNRDPAFSPILPYHVGMIQLEEGVMMSGAIFGKSPKIGEPVRAHFGELRGSGTWAAVWEVFEDDLRTET